MSYGCGSTRCSSARPPPPACCSGHPPLPSSSLPTHSHSTPASSSSPTAPPPGASEKPTTTVLPGHGDPDGTSPRQARDRVRPVCKSHAHASPPAELAGRRDDKRHPGPRGASSRGPRLHGERHELLRPGQKAGAAPRVERDRKSTRLNSSHPSISYAVFCLKKKKK